MPWKHKYIQSIKDGATDEQARLFCNVTKDTVDMELRNNEDFSNTYGLIKAGVGCTILNPEELCEMLETQASDELVAAYFGMKTERFLKSVMENEQLKLIYDTARHKGRAKMMKAAYHKGLSGDPKMLSHFLEHHEGMVSGGKGDSGGNTTVNIITTIEDAANKMAFLMQANALIKGNVIDGDAEEVVVEHEPDMLYNEASIEDDDFITEE